MSPSVQDCNLENICSQDFSLNLFIESGFIFVEHRFIQFQVTTDKDFEPANRKSSRKAAGELRAKNDEIFTEGNWNHVCVVLNKSVVRKSTASIYANGKCIVSTSKVRPYFLINLNLS